MTESSCTRSDGTEPHVAPASEGDEHRTQIKNALYDLSIAESWESMAQHSAARSKRRAITHCTGRRQRDDPE